MLPAFTRRAPLLGLALVVGCDIAAYVLDPKAPSFEQSWNLPGTTKAISVADLLPPGNVVRILPDSSGFSLTMDSTLISAVLGPNCVPCQPLNGTSAIKPRFTMSPGNSTVLPQDVVSAAVTAGQVTIKLTNNLTFDPLYVNIGAGSPPQGFLVIVVRSGSLVFGRDSVRGAAAVSGTNNAPFPPGSVLNRTINLSTGTATTSLTVDVTLDSPIGDHNVPINTTRTFDAVAKVPFVNVASVQMNVPARTINTGGGDLPLKDVPGSDNMYSATLLLDIVNPFAGVIGSDTARFVYGPLPTDVVVKQLNLPSGSAQRSIVLDNADIRKLIAASTVTFTIRGPVSAPAPITVSPKQKISITARFLAVIRTPPGGN